SHAGRREELSGPNRLDHVRRLVAVDRPALELDRRVPVPARGTESAAPVYEGTVVGRPLAETELVVRAQRGDASAFEELVRMHQASAFRTAYRVTRSAEDAEEVAADAFLKAFRALGRFRRGKPFRPWLLAIVANEARNRQRATGRRQALALRVAD